MNISIGPIEAALILAFAVVAVALIAFVAVFARKMLQALDKIIERIDKKEA